jgi:hypothetical protein
MKKTMLLLILLIFVIFLLAARPLAGAAPAGKDWSKAKLPKALAGLNGPFDLSADRKPEVQYFIQESTVIQIGFDGKRLSEETVTLKLKRIPGPISGRGGDEFICGGMEFRLADGQTATIPALEGWSYLFKEHPFGVDDKGQVFGIPHAKFESLADSRERELSVTHAYYAYNSFIDFHGIDSLARPDEGGAGIQDLTRMGQRIVHAAAGSEPPVNLGSRIKEGSFYKNGQVALVLKGLSLVEGAACAVIGFDSGESTLKMIIPAGFGMDVVTVGGSTYIGDIYIDLATRWVRKITLDEFIVTETRVPGPGQGQKIQAYTIRHLLTRLVSREEYESRSPLRERGFSY